MDYTLIPKKYAPVTPSDTTSLSRTMGLFVGVAGDVVVKGADDVQATFKVGAGQYLTGSFSKVMAATTATNIVALYGE